jgi:hypothetical protein
VGVACSRVAPDLHAPLTGTAIRVIRPCADFGTTLPDSVWFAFAGLARCRSACSGLVVTGLVGFAGIASLPEGGTRKARDTAYEVTSLVSVVAPEACLGLRLFRCPCFPGNGSRGTHPFICRWLVTLPRPLACDLLAGCGEQHTKSLRLLKRLFQGLFEVCAGSRV